MVIGYLPIAASDLGSHSFHLPITRVSEKTEHYPVTAVRKRAPISLASGRYDAGELARETIAEVSNRYDSSAGS